MRKALIGFLLAASAAVPGAALAQESEEPQVRTQREQRVLDRYERGAQRNMERWEQRQQRQHREPSHSEGHRDSARDGHHGRGRGHGALHRDLNREHREVHENNPSRREHRTWHRQAERGHDRYHRQWDSRWRDDRRYDWYGYRNRYRDIYRQGRYYDPYGYGYRRFNVGFRIGSPLYSQRYWINDPWRYRLPQPYAGYQWVRYYNDVVLVDTFSGEVVDVIYDFFW